jgi:hypothetical protein
MINEYRRLHDVDEVLDTRSLDDPDTGCREHGIERGGEAGVPVVQHELHPGPGVLQVQ